MNLNDYTMHELLGELTKRKNVTICKDGREFVVRWKPECIPAPPDELQSRLQKKPSDDVAASMYWLLSHMKGIRKVQIQRLADEGNELATKNFRVANICLDEEKQANAAALKMLQLDISMFEQLWKEYANIRCHGWPE